MKSFNSDLILLYYYYQCLEGSSKTKRQNSKSWPFFFLQDFFVDENFLVAHQKKIKKIKRKKSTIEMFLFFDLRIPINNL